MVEPRSLANTLIGTVHRKEFNTFATDGPGEISRQAGILIPRQIRLHIGIHDRFAPSYVDLSQRIIVAAAVGRDGNDIVVLLQQSSRVGQSFTGFGSGQLRVGHRDTDSQAETQRIGKTDPLGISTFPHRHKDIELGKVLHFRMFSHILADHFDTGIEIFEESAVSLRLGIGLRSGLRPEVRVNNGPIQIRNTVHAFHFQDACYPEKGGILFFGQFLRLQHFG